jgi:hypothetical protein
MRLLGLLALCGLISSSCSNLSDAEGAMKAEKLPWRDAEAAKTAARGLVPNSRAILVCGGPRGQSYFPPPEAGWTSDGMGEGALVLLALPDEAFDIVYRDTTGGYYSVLAEGAELRTIHAEEGRWAFTALHPGTTTMETYLFLGSSSGEKTAMWTQNKVRGIAGPMMAAFVNSCE